MFAIASGYEDCDDLDALRIDPAFKMACGRQPETGRDLMSQPTLSRLENAPSWRALARMGLGMVDLFCATFRRVPDRIGLDPRFHGDKHRRHGRSSARPAGPHSLQHPCGWLLLPTDPHFRGRFRQAGAVAAASGQEAFRRRSCASPAARHRPHPEQLAQGPDHGARRQPLCDARSAGSA